MRFAIICGYTTWFPKSNFWVQPLNNGLYNVFGELDGLPGFDDVFDEILRYDEIDPFDGFYNNHICAVQQPKNLHYS